MVKKPSLKETMEKPTNDLLFGSNQQKIEPIILVVSRKLQITNLSDSAVSFFKKTKNLIINSPLLDQLLDLDLNNDPLVAIIHSNNTDLIQTVELTHNSNRKNYFVTITNLFENDADRYIFNISPVNNSFELLKSYVNSIINNLPGAVYWKDLDGKYMGCNKFVATMAGYDNPEDMIGKTDYDLCWKEFADEWRTLDNKVINDNQTLTREEHAKLSNGNTITELTFKTPLKNEYDEIIGVIGTSLDITELKEAQIALIKAKERAEIGEQTKTEFIANVSHDIRTPLAGLVGLAHQVEEETTEPHQKDLITQIANCGDALFKMFVEILDNITAEHMTEKDLEIETFDLNSLAKEISELKKPSLTHKGLEFITSIDPKIPPFLVGDRRKIHRIILNLLGNAIKFTKQGHVEFKIGLVEKLPDKAILQFSIIDTGIGVPLESKSRLFERFYKASPSYKGEYKGFGLGLHIAETYTHLLDGTISFESAEGIGSNFYATIPLKIANEHEIEIYKQKLTEKKPSLLKINKNLNPELIIEKPKESQPIDLKIPENALHILVIEDNPTARILTINFIKKVKLKYTEAGDGETALELAKNQHFDLILADVGLPGISGTDFTKQLRLFEKEHNRQVIPIVGVTAHATTGRDECLSAGMNAVTPKPLSFATFKEILQNFLPSLKI